MENKKLKVVVVGTGNVAAIAIRGLKGREDMELVGVWGRRAELIGTDSGLLDIDEPNGVLITNDKEELFALKPDCAVMAINVRDPMQASAINGEWYKDFLSRGINVVSPSVPDLIWPCGAFNQPFVEEIRKAAEEGGASIFVNGQEPGYAEHQAMLLASCSNIITSLKLKMAMELMEGTDLSLDQISELVGYNSGDYLSKVFKRIYHISASEYRRRIDKD